MYKKILYIQIQLAIMLVLCTATINAAESAGEKNEQRDHIRNCILISIKNIEKVINYKNYKLVETIEEYYSEQGSRAEMYVYRAMNIIRNDENYYITLRKWSGNDYKKIKSRILGLEDVDSIENIVSNNTYKMLWYIDTEKVKYAIWSDERILLNKLLQNSAFAVATGWIEADNMYISSILKIALKNDVFKIINTRENNVDIEIIVEGSGKYIITLNKAAFRIEKFTYMKNIGDNLNGNILGDPGTPVQWIYNLSEIEYNKYDSITYPTSAISRLKISYNDNIIQYNVIKYRVVELQKYDCKTCIVPLVPEIPDGTSIKRLGDNVKYYYQWLGSKVVPVIDNRLAYKIRMDVSRIVDKSRIVRNNKGRYYEVMAEESDMPGTLWFAVMYVITSVCMTLFLLMILIVMKKINNLSMRYV